MHEFIEHDNKEWNLSSTISRIPSNVVVDIKTILILSSQKRICFLGFLSYENFTLKQLGQ